MKTSLKKNLGRNTNRTNRTRRKRLSKRTTKHQRSNKRAREYKKNLQHGGAEVKAKGGVKAAEDADCKQQTADHVAELQTAKDEVVSLKAQITEHEAKRNAANDAAVLLQTQLAALVEALNEKSGVPEGGAKEMAAKEMAAKKAANGAKKAKKKKAEAEASGGGGTGGEETSGGVSGGSGGGGGPGGGGGSGGRARIPISTADLSGAGKPNDKFSKPLNQFKELVNLIQNSPKIRELLQTTTAAAQGQSGGSGGIEHAYYKKLKEAMAKGNGKGNPPDYEGIVTNLDKFVEDVALEGGAPVAKQAEEALRTFKQAYKECLINFSTFFCTYLEMRANPPKEVPKFLVTIALGAGAIIARPLVNSGFGILYDQLTPTGLQPNNLDKVIKALFNLRNSKASDEVLKSIKLFVAYLLNSVVTVTQVTDGAITLPAKPKEPAEALSLYESVILVLMMMKSSKSESTEKIDLPEGDLSQEKLVEYLQTLTAESSVSTTAESSVSTTAESSVSTTDDIPFDTLDDNTGSMINLIRTALGGNTLTTIMIDNLIDELTKKQEDQDIELTEKEINKVISKKTPDAWHSRAMINDGAKSKGLKESVLELLGNLLAEEEEE
jgi:hypothetical protein